MKARSPDSGHPARPRRAVRFATVLLAALALGGCAAVGPDYRKPELPVPAAWHAGATGTSPMADATLAEWWTSLGDATLTRLVQRAETGSLDLRSARARLREARARRALAGAQTMPTLAASASAGASKSSAKAGSGAHSNHYSAGFDASWEADLFGALRRAEEAAQADLEASVADLDAARVSLAAEVALNYVELRAAQARLAIARANLASQSETLQLTDWRAQAGLVTRLDVDQARASVEQVRAQIPALETSQAEARNRLAILLGQAPGSLDAELAAPGAIPAVPDQVVVGIPADTLRQRPDLSAAERRLAAETARVGVAEANRYPGLTLNGSLGLEALSPAGLFSSRALADSLLARVAGTLFDAGRLRQQVEIQDAVRERALVGYQSALLAALQDVENALTALDNARRRGAALRDAEQAAASADRLAHLQYAAGLVDFQAVLNTQRTLLSVQDNLKSSEADAASALIQLYKALGGGWQARRDEPASLAQR